MNDRRTELAMFQPPLSAPDADSAAPRAVVLPAPAAAGGELPTLDGRTQRVPDPALLADTINGQPIEVRVDADHQSEPISPTYHGSTHAYGWLRDFRAESDGSISAEFHLMDIGAALLRSRAYRYLSPALLLRENEVVGISSVALVNNPNLLLEAPAVHNETSTQPDEQQSSAAADPPAGDREAALNQREAALNQRELRAAEAAVDRAVGSKRILPAQKEFMLNSIRRHPQGIAPGLAEFETAIGAAGVSSAAADLDRRTGPTGAPPSAPTSPAVVGPVGYRPSDNQERLQMHARIADHARSQKIAYRDAVVELHG